MTFYGTFASGAGWVVPKKYIEQVGVDGFKKHPIGLGPYKFVSNKPGVELVMEAYEGYWRKVPSVKRLVYKSVTDATTRMAMLKRGEVDLAYLIDTPMAEEVKRDPNLKLAFSGGIGTMYLDFFDMWDPKSPWHDKRVRQAASYAIDRRAHQRGGDSWAPRFPPATWCPRASSSRCLSRPIPTIPPGPSSCSPRRAIPTGSTRATSTPGRPTSSTGEAVTNYLAAVGIKTRVRAMERAASTRRPTSKKLKGLCVCVTAVYGNAASRISEIVPASGAYAYGGWPDIDALYAQQARETDRKKREVLLHRIQRDARRARPLRADLRLYLAERGGATRGGARPHAHQPVSLVGAPRRGAPQEIGDAMLAMWVKVRIKPDQRKRFLDAIEADALGSERDEPGCLRFNVLQDEKDPNVYYFFEVYKDQAALEAHRTMPHYATWRAAADTLDGPTEPTRCQTVFPSARAYWGKV